MKKIFIKSQGAGWVIDSISNDFKKHTSHKIVKKDPDIVWSLNAFGFRSIYGAFDNCKYVLHLHHIDETKLKEYPFNLFNKANICIVPNKITERVAKKYLSIPIVRMPYWLLSNATKEKSERSKKIRNKLKQNDEILIGSFVKDGNGKTGDTPKLSKGPDTLVSILKKISKNHKIKVLLAGYCRKWTASNLKKHNIPYVYYERFDDVVDLYDSIDWYFATSRYEGGPQSVLEASYRKVKILSTDVGLASDVLHPDCICNSVGDFVDKFEVSLDRIGYNYNSVHDHYRHTVLIPEFDKFFEGM